MNVVLQMNLHLHVMEKVEIQLKKSGCKHRTNIRLFLQIFVLSKCLQPDFFNRRNDFDGFFLCRPISDLFSNAVNQQVIHRLARKNPEKCSNVLSYRNRLWGQSDRIQSELSPSLLYRVFVISNSSNYHFFSWRHNYFMLNNSVSQVNETGFLSIVFKFILWRQSNRMS